MSWPAGFGWLSLLAEYLIKSTLTLALGLIFVGLFRKRSASLRHFILSLSLGGLLLLPALPYLSIGWETSWLPARSAVTSASSTTSAAAKAAADAPGRMEQRSVFLAASGSSSLRGISGQERSIAGISAFLSRAALPLIWSAGIIFLLVRLAAGLFGAFRLTREGEAVRDPRWRVLLERLIALVHLRRKVRLKAHREVLIPLTWGFFKPVVLIPAGHEAWTEEQRSSALVHELSHVKRADFLVMVLVRLSLAFFWFNPLSWIVFRRLRNEQEEACDEWVMRTGIKPSTYAANLLFFKTTAGSRPAHLAALLGLFGFGRSAFNERLTAILKQKWTFQEVKMKTKVLLFCAVILAVALIGLARPSTSAAKAAETPEGAIAAAGPDILDLAGSAVSPEIPAADQAQEPSQAEEPKAQEKKQQEPAEVREKQEKEEEKKPVVVVTIKEGKKHKHEIIIREGDKVKTISFDKPVIIKEGAGGKVLLITPGGETVKVLEGEPAHLEIIADKLKFIKEGKILKIGKDGGVVYVIGDQDVDIAKAVKVALKNIPWAVDVVVEPDIDIGKEVEVALEEVPVTVKIAEPATPHITVEPKIKIAEPATFHITRVSEDLENKIREKLQKIREQLKEVEEKKIELRAVDEALADLEKDLEKMSEETSRVVVKHSEKPEVYTVIPRKIGKRAHREIAVGVPVGFHKEGVKVIVKEKGAFSLYCQIDPGEKGREAYDRIVARVKRELPEGFTLEPEFEQESGLITLKVSGPTDKETPEDLINKLADTIRDEAKEKKQ